MNDITRNREACWNILTEYTKSEALIKHALSVETCVRSYAQKFNEDEEYWGNVALLLQEKLSSKKFYLLVMN